MSDFERKRAARGGDRGDGGRGQRLEQGVRHHRAGQSPRGPHPDAHRRAGEPPVVRVVPRLLRAPRLRRALHHQGHQHHRRLRRRHRLPPRPRHLRRRRGRAVAPALRRQLQPRRWRRQDPRQAPVLRHLQGPELGPGHPQRQAPRRPLHLLLAAAGLQGDAVPGRPCPRRLHPQDPARRRPLLRAAPVLGGHLRGHQRRQAPRLHHRLVGVHRDHAAQGREPSQAGRRRRHARRAPEEESQRGREGADAGVGRPDLGRRAQEGRPHGDARRGDDELLPGHRRALRALPPEPRRLRQLRAGPADLHHVHAPPEDRRRRPRHAEEGDVERPAASDRQLRRGPGPLRRALRHAVPLAVRDAGRRPPRRLPPAQLCDGGDRQGRAEGAVARHSLPPRGPRGVGRALQLRAAVAQAGRQGPPRPAQGPRRRHHPAVARHAGRGQGDLERAAVPVHRRRRRLRVPGHPGGRGEGGAGERQGPDHRPEHPGRVHLRHPSSQELHLHREPVLPGELLLLEGGRHQARGRRCASPHPQGALHEGGEQDRGRRAVHRLRRGAHVAGGHPGERLRAGHPRLAEEDHGDDVHRHRPGHPGQGDRRQPQGLPHLLLPRQPRGQQVRRVPAAGAGRPRLRLPQGAAESPLHDLRPHQDDDRGRRVHHRGIGQHQPEVHGRGAGLGDRHGSVPAVPPAGGGPAGEGPGARLPDGAVVRAPRHGRRDVHAAGHRRVRAQGERHGGQVLGPVRRRRPGARPPRAPPYLPRRRRRQRRRHPAARRGVLPGHRGEDSRRQVRLPPTDSHHIESILNSLHHVALLALFLFLFGFFVLEINLVTLLNKNSTRLWIILENS